MLSQEQIDVLKKIAEATGEDVLELVRQAGASSKQLEALGIAHKSKALQEGRKLLPAPQGESFGREFVRCAAGPRDEKVKSESVLPGILDKARASADHWNKSGPLTESLADATKLTRGGKAGALPDANAEALAQQVARALKPEFDRLLAEARDALRRLEAMEGARDARLAALEGRSKGVGPGPYFLPTDPSSIMLPEEVAGAGPVDFSRIWGIPQ